jgi:hypothetical protein
LPAAKASRDTGQIRSRTNARRIQPESIRLLLGIAQPIYSQGDRIWKRRRASTARIDVRGICRTAKTPSRQAVDSRSDAAYLARVDQQPWRLGVFAVRCCHLQPIAAAVNSKCDCPGPIARVPSVRFYPPERRHPAGRGGRGLPRHAGGMHARAHATGLGVFAAWPGEHAGAADARLGPHGVGAGYHAGRGRGLSRARQRLLAAEPRAARRNGPSAPGSDAEGGAISARRARPAVGKLPPTPYLWPADVSLPNSGIDRCDGFRRTDPIHGAGLPRRAGLPRLVASGGQPGPRKSRRQAGRGLPRRFAFHNDSAWAGRGSRRGVVRLDRTLFPRVVSTWPTRRLKTLAPVPAPATPARSPSPPPPPQAPGRHPPRLCSRVTSAPTRPPSNAPYPPDTTATWDAAWTLLASSPT